MNKIEIKKSTEEFLRKIDQMNLLRDLKIEEINESVKKIAKEIRGDITTTQLRKVYGEIKRLQREEGFNERELYMLEPRLAYASARGKQYDIYAIFEKSYPKIRDKKDLNTFAYILEALVAYHRYEEELKKRGE
jgi:CRISPR type III-A-associated protein Csm2